MGYKTLLQRLVLYALVAAYVTSFVSSLVIAIILSVGTNTLGKAGSRTNPQHEEPILGQFGPISTVVLLIGIPLLILITLGVYVYFLSMSKSKRSLAKF